MQVSGRGEETRAAPVSGGASLGTVEALLAVQGVGDATQQRRQGAAKRAEDLLTRLEEIRDGILVGAVSRQRLQELVDRLAVRRQAEGDPRLTILLDEIELRAKVELAKLAVI